MKEEACGNILTFEFFYDLAMVYLLLLLPLSSLFY